MKFVSALYKITTQNRCILHVLGNSTISHAIEHIQVYSQNLTQPHIRVGSAGPVGLVFIKPLFWPKKEKENGCVLAPGLAPAATRALPL